MTLGIPVLDLIISFAVELVHQQLLALTLKIVMSVLELEAGPILVSNTILCWRIFFMFQK